MTFTPRPKQAEVLRYRRGHMGVAAVPGSGKTSTLSYLASQLLAEVPLQPNQEILVVTLVKAAVGNFARQISGFVRASGLLAGYGYRVRTLHGLANDIVRERPALVNLSDAFTIIDEREAGDILQDAVDAWILAHPSVMDDFVDEEYEGKPSIETKHWPEAVFEVANTFIRQAKDWELSPDEVYARLEAFPQPIELAEMGHQIYVQYQRALAYRGAVDFQDLIRLARAALLNAPDYLARLQNRWPYILEDEAQDSSQLQEQILRLLVGEGGNWVRVGDPNQAIYETFTTANPQFLRDFLTEPGVQARELPNSGRSQPSIIALANGLIDWTLHDHPADSIRELRPLQPPHILQTPPGDPQPNPPDNPAAVFVMPNDYTPEQELLNVIGSAERWIAENPDLTCAILVPRNARGFAVANALKRANIPYVELLRSTTGTREVAGALGNLLRFLAHPADSDHLATAYRVWRRAWRDDEESSRQLTHIASLLKKANHVEAFLYPVGESWTETVPEARENGELHDELEAFRALAQRWQGAANLPVDQLMLTLAQDLFTEPAELAAAHSMALYLRRTATVHPGWHLPEFTEELRSVARNERRFLGLEDEATAFDADAHPGKVAVMTIHGAKGLEWDRVFLMSVNDYDFPAGLPGDSFIGEKWFVRDRLNLQAEALGQLRALRDSGVYIEGNATQQDRVLYVAERLRLLYVGVTRARRELVITHNTGRKGNAREAAAVTGLRAGLDFLSPLA